MDDSVEVVSILETFEPIIVIDCPLLKSNDVPVPILITTSNVSMPGVLRHKERVAAAETVRAVGVEIGAFDEILWPPTRWWFRRLGYDLPEAKGALIGYSNALPSRDGSRAVYRCEAEKALKLAMSYSEKPATRDP